MDMGAILALFEAANGLFWLHKECWSTNVDLSDWHGLTIDDYSRVVKLRLHNNNLKG